MLRLLRSVVLTAAVASATVVSAQSTGDALELVEVRTLAGREQLFTATIMRASGAGSVILTNATDQVLSVLDANLVEIAWIKPGRALDLSKDARISGDYVAISVGAGAEPAYLDIAAGISVRVEPQVRKAIAARISEGGNDNE